ncbi:MAG: hypothetical protein NTW21_31955 [Verrucomicrobia bacterium]|nr:hypothetical protein [Verrucomicrobiota bacterium]
MLCSAASDGHRPPLQSSDGHRPPLQSSDGHRPLQCLCIGLLSIVLTAGPAQADPKIDEALKLAATYLVSQQGPQGMIGDPFPMPNTSLAVLALAACGHQPTDTTPEGLAMRKAIDYVLLPDNQTSDGYFGKVDNSRMYGHGITTLMLAEMSGMGLNDAQDTRIRQKCQLGVELILRAQGLRKDAQNTGGWQYEPDSRGSDLSVTCWQTMALRAAQNAGLEVPREAIDKVVAYMRRLYKPLGDKRGPTLPGGFGYSAPGNTTSTTAEGLLAMQVCGQYQAEETLAAAELLFQLDIQKEKSWFFYTTYYYAQGMYQRGGKFADAAQRLVPAMLLPLQSREGWWQSVGGDEAGPGKTYCTSLAVLALAVKNHFLPIYQR